MEVMIKIDTGVHFCEHTDWVAVMTMKAVELTRYCKKSKTGLVLNNEHWVFNLQAPVQHINNSAGLQQLPCKMK